MLERHRRQAVAVFLLLCACASAKTQDGDAQSTPPNANAGSKTTPAVWTAYFGSHDVPAAWAHSIRGIGRGLTGTNAAGAAAGTDSRDQLEVRLAKSVSSAIGSRDLVIPVGGLGAAKDLGDAVNFLLQIEADSGRAWKAIVHNQAVLLGQLRAGRGRVFWQVGNEINSPNYSRAVHQLDDVAIAARDDPTVIPVYAEYYLAPTVEALQQVQRDSSEKVDVNIVLGSIASADRPAARDWLERLLKYEVRGTYARSLTGRRVADLVDIISIHYLVTNDDDEWRLALDGLYDTWVDQGPAEGLWATEELGRRRAADGLGAVTVLKVASRYLSWWADRSLSPEQSRTFFWGWRMGEPGTRGADGMEALLRSLGDVRLVDKTHLLAATDGNVEARLFQSFADSTRRVIIMTGKSSRAVSLSYIVMDAGGWSGRVQASLEVFTRAGQQGGDVRTAAEDDSYRLSFPENLELSNAIAAIVKLDNER